MKNLSHTTAYLLIATVLIVGIFGITGMNHMGMNCDPSAPNSACPATQLGMVLHHISTYENLMQAVIPSVSVLVISVLFLLAAIMLLTRKFSPDPAPALVQIGPRTHSDSRLTERMRTLRWLSRFEHSPSSIARR